jgi:hypothetical protein
MDGAEQSQEWVTDMSRREWQPIETAPQNTMARFKQIDGTILDGVAEPYWCGSDCPCGDGTDPLLSGAPQCWRMVGDDEGTLTNWMSLPEPSNG